MRRYKLMMRNIDQQILLLERLDDGRENDGDDFQRGGGDGGLGYENAGVKFVLVDVLGEGAHLLYTDAGVGGKFDPDGTDLGLRVGVGFCRYRGVLCEHGVGGSEGGVHFLAAGVGVLVSWYTLMWRIGGGGSIVLGWETDSGAPLGSA